MDFFKTVSDVKSMKQLFHDIMLKFDTLSEKLAIFIEFKNKILQTSSSG